MWNKIMSERKVNNFSELIKEKNSPTLESWKFLQCLFSSVKNSFIITTYNNDAP